MSAALSLRDDLRELASLYETVRGLDPNPGAGARHGVHGPRVPPGFEDVIADDESTRAFVALDEWAAFLAHVLLDETSAPPAPASTPGRLRLVAEYASHFAEHDDPMLALAVADDVAEHLRMFRRLARRDVRVVRTGVHCERCGGHLVSPLGRTDDRHDDALECERCGARVPYVVWSGWPRARVRYITAEHAARMLSTSVAAVRMRASRGQWRRIGTGRDVRYFVDDVRNSTSVIPNVGASG